MLQIILYIEAEERARELAVRSKGRKGEGGVNRKS